MNSSQVGILEQRDEISLSSFLKSHHSRRLETKIRLSNFSLIKPSARQLTHLEILSNLTNKSLERQLANQKLGRLLIPSDFTQGDSTRTESVRFLDSTGGCLICLVSIRDDSSNADDDDDDDKEEVVGTHRCGFPGCFGSELFTRCFTCKEKNS